MQKRFSVGEAARIVGVSKKTLYRWEKARKGGLKKVLRDYKGHRIYTESQVRALREFRQRVD